MTGESITVGVLEKLLGIDRANRVRELTPFLTPICVHGRMVTRCTEHATVYRENLNSYVCDVHGFSPYWGDIANKPSQHGHWRLLDTSRDVPASPAEFTTPFIRGVESNAPMTTVVGYAYLLHHEYDYEADIAYDLARAAFQNMTTQ